MALSSWLTVILATAPAAEKKGREPPRTLEDLLLQAEQMANQQPDKKNVPAPANQPVPANPNAAPQPVDPQQIVNDMQRLIAARDQIVARSQLFQTLRELRREEPKLSPLVEAVKMATQNAKKAENQLNIVAGITRGAGPGGPGPGAGNVAAAQANLGNAMAIRNNAITAADRFYNNELLPRYQRIGPELPRFFENYGQMRKLIPLDRQYPARDRLLAELDRETQLNREFVEGHILTGILHAYAGKANEAEAAFKNASDMNEQCGLAFTPLGYDCSYGLLLVGKPNLVDGYVKILKAFDADRETSAACWLIGAHAFSKGQYNEASKFLYKAFTKAGETASPQLRGEVAWLYLFAENKVNIERAQELLRDLGAESAWQVKRANAGLAAERGNFPEALALMEGCLASAPPHFDAELADQQDAYKAGRVWLRSGKGR